MSVNVSIKVDGENWSGDVDKLRVHAYDGGLNYVPDDGINLVKLTAGANGTYQASDYEAYGISEFKLRKNASVRTQEDSKEIGPRAFSISEGGKNFYFPACKIRTNNNRWVSEKDVRLTQINAFQDGIYRAEDYDAYGFSKVYVFYTPDGSDPTRGRNLPPGVLPQAMPGTYTDGDGINAVLVWQSNPIPWADDIPEFRSVYIDPMTPTTNKANYLHFYGDTEDAREALRKLEDDIHMMIAPAMGGSDDAFTESAGYMYYLTRAMAPNGKWYIYILPREDPMDRYTSLMIHNCGIYKPGETLIYHGETIDLSGDLKVLRRDTRSRVQGRQYWQTGWTSPASGEQTDDLFKYVPESDYDKMELFTREYIAEHCPWMP